MNRKRQQVKGEAWSRGTNPSLPFEVNVILNLSTIMKTKLFQKKILSNEFRSNTLKGTKERLVAKKWRCYFGGRGRWRGVVMPNTLTINQSIKNFISLGISKDSISLC